MLAHGVQVEASAAEDWPTEQAVQGELDPVAAKNPAVHPAQEPLTSPYPALLQGREKELSAIY